MLKRLYKRSRLFLKAFSHLNPYLHKEYAIVQFISLQGNKMIGMFSEYIQAAMEKAQFKLIDNGEEPYFIEIPELDGVWATGQTVEDASHNFIEALEDWIAAHIMWNLALPPIRPLTHPSEANIIQAFPFRRSPADLL